MTHSLTADCCRVSVRAAHSDTHCRCTEEWENLLGDGALVTIKRKNGLGKKWKSAVSVEPRVLDLQEEGDPVVLASCGSSGGRLERMALIPSE